MNKTQKMVESLEKNYQVNVEDILTDYDNLCSVECMANNAGVSKYKMKNILQHLQLKRPKTKRKACYDEFWAMFNDEQIDEFTEELEEENTALTKKVHQLERALTKSRFDVNLYRKEARDSAKAERLEEKILKAFKSSLSKPQPLDVTLYVNSAIPERYNHTACLVLSDLHVEETVVPEQVGKLNAFNWEIMEKRLESVFINFLRKYQGESRAVILLAGDLFSGIIHQQLENSSKPIADAVVKLAQILSKYLKSLACVFDEVEVYSVNGNHGRLSENIKTEAKGFDFEYLHAHMLKAMCPEIKFDISTTGFTYFEVSGVVNAVHHGDFFRQPVGNEARDLNIYESFLGSTGKEATNIIQGHTHKFQVYNTTKGTCIVNGSLVGSNNFGHTNGFTKIPASQTMIMFEPDGDIEYVKQLKC